MKKPTLTPTPKAAVDADNQRPQFIVQNCHIEGMADAKGLAAVELAKAIGSIAKAAEVLANRLDMSGQTIGMNFTNLESSKFTRETSE